MDMEYDLNEYFVLLMCMCFCVQIYGPIYHYHLDSYYYCNYCIHTADDGGVI